MESSSINKWRPAVIILVCGAGLLVGGMASIIHSIALAAQYDTTEAKVVSSSVRREEKTLSTGKLIIWHYPKVVYTFTYKNKVYTLERYESPEGRYTIAATNAIIEHYPEGKIITIYFPPGKPTEAVIKMEPASTLSYILSLGGALLLIAGLRLHWQYRRKRRAHNTGAPPEEPGRNSSEQ